MLNYLPASDVPCGVDRRGATATIYANIHVGVGDRAASAPQARDDLFSYAVVNACACSFTGPDSARPCRPSWPLTARETGPAPLAAVPDEMVDAINVTGDQALVAATIGACRRAGVDVPVVFPLTWGAAGQDALDSTLQAAMAPAAPDASQT